MTLTLPGQTLRGVAAKLRQLSYVPTNWQGVLAGLNADGREQLEVFFDELVVRVHTILAVGLVRGPGLAFSTTTVLTCLSGHHHELSLHIVEFFHLHGRIGRLVRVAVQDGRRRRRNSHDDG